MTAKEDKTLVDEQIRSSAEPPKYAEFYSSHSCFFFCPQKFSSGKVITTIRADNVPRVQCVYQFEKQVDLDMEVLK